MSSLKLSRTPSRLRPSPPPHPIRYTYHTRYSDETPSQKYKPRPSISRSHKSTSQVGAQSATRKTTSPRTTDRTFRGIHPAEVSERHGYDVFIDTCSSGDPVAVIIIYRKCSSRLIRRPWRQLHACTSNFEAQWWGISPESDVTLALLFLTRGDFLCVPAACACLGAACVCPTSSAPR